MYMCVLRTIITIILLRKYWKEIKLADCSKMNTNIIVIGGFNIDDFNLNCLLQ